MDYERERAHSAAMSALLAETNKNASDLKAQMAEEKRRSEENFKRSKICGRRTRQRLTVL